jgi:hypothetical protein
MKITSTSEEVATMESIYTTQRPSLLAPACAPSAFLPPITAAMRAPLPQVDQVQIQAELARTAVIGNGGVDVQGFVDGTGVSVKGAAGGVPPRGRPV